MTEARATGGNQVVDCALRDKVAIVTGAGSAGPLPGIGVATAMVLARRGASVAIADMSPERAEITRERIVAEGGRACVTIGDVTVESDCRRIVEEAVRTFGALHVMVNNAAIVAGGPVTQTDRAAWDRCLAVNLTSVMLLGKYAVPEIASAGGGAIVNVASIAALRAMGAGAYAASKAALIALTRDMAFDHGRHGIRVNCVAPGYVHTPMGTWGGPTVRELHRRSVLLNREGTPWDVASAIAFLASAEASWITGVTLPVDGGTIAATVQENWPWRDELGPLLTDATRAISEWRGDTGE